jgi:hypothetical protein
VLREELANNDDFRKRFLRESRYAASLDHPHVVVVHDAGEAGGVLYIVMEYVEGTDLDELPGDGPLSPAEGLPLLEQVAAALDAAHAIGLLHRDVKPGILLIDETAPELRCVLTDFGLGKQVPRDSVALTAAGRLRRHARVHGAGADTRQGHGHRRRHLFAGVFAVRVPGGRRDLPQALDRAIAKALAKNPADRHATCLELVEHAAVAASVELPPASGGGRDIAQG